MNRLMKTPNTLQIVYSKQPLPESITKSIFLAGPTPRDNTLCKSWRPQAIEYLKELGYTGTVFVPEDSPNNERWDPTRYEEQCDWEHKCLHAADAIVFWIPREERPDFQMIALTTNVEFGLFFNSNKLIIGGPDNAVHNRYLKYIAKDKYPWHNDLKDLLRDTIKFIGVDTPRTGTEVLIPSFIFNSNQFQNWYSKVLEIGNHLENFRMEYSFYMPKAKKLFLAIWKPDVFIESENRVKDNEFVIARTDMSYICAYVPAPDILDSKLIVCEEFRSPIRSNDEMVFELPGGSSLKDNEDRLQTAAEELFEETGVQLPKERFKFEEIKQSAATLCSHQIALFSVELTEDELNNVDTQHIHGVEEETERIHVHIMTVREFMEKSDWTNIGMVLSILKG